VSILSDLRAVRRVVRNALRSKGYRRQIQSHPPAPIPPGSILIGVYFADTRVNLYQIRQWYAPLAELATRYPVAIIARSPSAALSLTAESPVPVVYLRGVTDIERFLAQQDLRMVFYVNQNTRNFQMFRYGRMWHVFINHGESDKVYMTSNQYKAYDYAFVAGQAALDRLGRKLWDYDLERRAIAIGRPQADHLVGEAPFDSDGRTVVFYAPTWEGDRPAAAYGSIETHGVAIVDAILASPAHRLVYRPHPRSGVNSAPYGEANNRIIQAIADANARDPRAQHVYDDGKELGWQMVVADVAITDVSAMIYDRLATGKPLIVTRPASPTALIDESGFLGSAEWLVADEAADVLATIDRALTDEGSKENLAHWSRHHFGDITPGAATARFHAAVDRLIALWEQHAVQHVNDSRGESDPLDDEDTEGFPTPD
jgi:hypothetical protein